MLFGAHQFLICYLFIITIRSNDAKSVEGQFYINTSGFHYLTKFGCSIGECPWKIRIRLIKPWISASLGSALDFTHGFQDILQKAPPTAISIKVMLDVTWEQSPVNRRPKCSDMHLAHITKSLNVPLNGEWSEWEEDAVNQHIRPHLWYFIAEDCSGIIAESIASSLSLNKERLRPLKFEWEFEALQPDGSQFSYELFGTFRVAIFHSFCYGAVLIFMGLYEVREIRKTGKIHVMVQMLNVCVLSQISSSSLHIAHLLAYKYNGSGLPYLDTIAETFSIISQIVMSSVMIFIAMGLTLNVPNAAKRVESIGFPIIILITVLHIGLVS